MLDKAEEESIANAIGDDDNAARHRSGHVQPVRRAQEQALSSSADATADCNEAAALAEEFLHAVHNGDKIKAKDFLCYGSETIDSKIPEDATGGSADLIMAPISKTLYETLGGYHSKTTGTVNGEEISNSYWAIVKDESGADFCNNIFLLIR